jgi:glycosyltransferase involved in cell wall biosynthesis
MRISVIIPSYNGESKIGNILQALVAQSFKNFEVVVAIDGSKDQTQEIANGCQERLDLKVITQRNRGRAAVRNFGAANATGDLLIFFDDDMTPSPDAVKKHYEFHSQNANIILAGNPIENIEPQKSDIQNYKAWLTKQWTAKYLQDITPLNLDNLFFAAANCSIPRNIFDQLNGFDDRITDGEDYDFAYRALEKKIPVYFDRTNTAVHHDPITCASYLERIRQYRQAHKILNKFHPERRSPTDNSSPFKHWVYRLFAHQFFVHAIDNGSLFMALPIKIRYRLYSIIIHSLTAEYPNIAI